MLIAMDLAMILSEEGIEVIGPCTNVDDALRAARESKPDAALLDVDLHGKAVFPVADALVETGVPIIFHTGRGELDQLRAAYESAPVLPKPSDPSVVIKHLDQVLDT